MNTISFRIAAAMLPVLVVLLSLFGVATALREGEVLKSEMHRDAVAVASVAATLLATPGTDPAVLDAIELPRVEVDVVEAEPLLAQDGSVRAKAPIRRDGRTVGWVVVSESLADRDAFVRRALLTDALGVLVSALVAGAFAVAVGRTLVQSRVVRIIERLDQVASEQLHGPPLDLGRDELGQLGGAVESMTRELQLVRSRAGDEAAARRRAQLQLRRADRLALVGRTVAVFAHEVGNPLSVIVGRVERIARKHPGASQDARIVLEQADRIAAFVRRLLDYSRHDDGFELVSTDLSLLLGQAVELVGERARARDVTVRIEAPGGVATADVDPQAIVQAMTNLLANAIDASPDGGEVDIRLSTAECAAAMERGLSGEHLHIAVSDHGEGIPDDIRDRVLDPFFTTKQSGDGTGLGLSIVTEITGDHGGFLTLEDAEDGGCRAVIHLPSGGGSRG